MSPVPFNPVLAPVIKSVQFTPPPAHLIPDLRKSIDTAVAQLRGDETFAGVLVGTKKGDTVLVNLAVVWKPDDHWAIYGYVANKWGDSVVDVDDLEVGGGLKWAF